MNNATTIDYCKHFFITRGHPLYEKPIEKAFFGCKDIEEITIPKTWTYIPANCFSGCVSLKRINCEGEIKYIDFGAFRECFHLETIDFQAPMLDYFYSHIENKTLVHEQSIDTCFGIKDLDICGVIVDDTDLNYYGIWDVFEYKMYYAPKDDEYKIGCLVKCKNRPVVIKNELPNNSTSFKWFKLFECSIIGTYSEKEINQISKRKSSIYQYYMGLYQYNNDILEFIEQKKNYVDSINIEDVINNYHSIVDEQCRTKVGDNDDWFLDIYTGTNISDVYIDKLLPKESIHQTESIYGGYPSWRHEEYEYRDGKKWVVTSGIDYNRREIEKRNETIREQAKKAYSSKEHLKAIVNNQILQLIESNHTVKSELQIERAELLISKCKKDTDYFVWEKDGTPIGRYTKKHIPYSELIELIDSIGLSFSIYELKQQPPLFQKTSNKTSR